MKPSLPALLVGPAFLLASWLPVSTSFSIDRTRKRGLTRALFSAVSPNDIASRSSTTVLGDVASQNASTRTRDTATTTTPPALSVIYPGIEVDTHVWKAVCPTVLENARGVDVRRQWQAPYDQTTSTTTAVAEQIAASMVTEIAEQRRIVNPSQRDDMQASLTPALQAFMDFCHVHLQPSAVTGGYTARIVATRGAPSTKCPAWHQDHVPVRWIHSLVGPGCEWVEWKDLANSNNSAWTWEHNSDENDTAKHDDDEESSTLSVEILNQQRVPVGTPIHQAAPGQAVLLVGRSWPQTCRRPDERHFKPVVHKSPSGVPPWQGRVLLTMDVVPSP